MPVSVLIADATSRRAAFELVLVGALCGAAGVQVVLRRLAFYTASLAHAAFPGLVLAELAGVNVWWGASGTSLALAAVLPPPVRVGSARDTVRVVGVGLSAALGRERC